MAGAGASVYRTDKLSSFSFYTLLHLLLLLLSLNLAVSHSPVRYLPGFPGPLPFELETGYVGVDESEDVQFFYFFLRSERNPKEDPVMLWLTGGPGCSAFSGLAFEIEHSGIDVSPLTHLNLEGTTFVNPYVVASIIFLDSPVGTGFSYSRTLEGSKTGDTKSCDQIYQFLRKWLIDHPEFLSNPFYIAGDSYSGKTIPLLVQYISDGNGAGIEPFINLKGYLLGNPVTDSNLEGNTRIPYAHGMGLISDETYETIKRSCAGEYINVNPSNVQCTQDLQAYYETNGYLLSYYWINDMTVREALHIQEGTVSDWQRCSYGLPYNYEIQSSIEYHVNLSKRGYRSLVYSGDHDLTVTFLATQAWIRSLNYSIIDDWRQWSVDGQVGGYTRTYSNNMTFATVKGGGHTAPEYQPKECFAMFKRWISNEPL